MQHTLSRIHESLPLTARRAPPTLPFLLAYMSGLCGFFPATRYFIAPGLLPLVLFLFALFLTHDKTLSRKSIIVLCLAGFGYLAPALPDLTRSSNNIIYHIEEGKTSAVKGKIISPPRVLENRTYYMLELESFGTPPQRVNGIARVSVYKQHDIFKAGDRVGFDQVRLKIPRNFKNPGRFDYRLYLKSKGIDVTGTISKPETMKRSGRFDLPFWHAGLHQLRSRLVASLEKLFPGEEGTLLKAMVLGMKDSLPTEVRENYIATGLAHLMAVSGLHIGFVAAASYFLLWPIVFFILSRLKPDSARAGHTKKVTAVLCLIPVLFYMVVVGPKVSSLRAGIMVSALLIAVLVDRQSSLFNVFLSAGFIILLWKPASIMDAGFQLSFLAVGGILLVITLLSQINSDPVARMGEPTWSQKLMRTSTPDTQESMGQYLKSRFEKILIGGVLISVTVTAVTLPVLIYQFNRVSLVGVFLNILMVPLASLLIPTVLLMIMVGTFSTALAALPAWPIVEITRFFLWLPEVVANFSFASLYVPTPPSLWLVFYFSALFSGLLILQTKAFNKEVGGLLKKSFTVSVLVALVLFSWPRAFQFSGDTLTISMLDVGQGESLLIEFPTGETLVMDGGGFYKNRLDVGKRVVAPYLWHRGIRNIDYMVATHSDNDHIRGLHSLLDLFPVKHFLTLGEGFVGWRLQKLEKKSREKGAQFIPLKINKSIRIGDVRLTPLHPGPEPGRPSNQRVDNDLSLVLRLDYRDFSMLFTGDIGDKVEKKLVTIPHQLEADILKGPHHGSRFSNSQNFIDAVHPGTVIFSSGYLNRMRHPHPETLRRYSEAGVTIWRTDLNGAIKITTDGNNYEIQTHEIL
ncbi:MAG: DNA internalization-related competence protein ComEC/Rec2 [Nitrospina sp.]|nr:DNA internalization-related competence protein ComEC/Rec2 [Nitrospina sp.]MBT4619948.1 DNA internalization-related competence protein ComEC/Rec2 [Nitrospina sp.]MBT5959340.1 DNA internalization-related competence protein ComEC/Rec2 [Nitrospina sp.]MBT6855788.1 DNA internalization-related competence protein ComEC/Rec2 [Nitrospina sp.]